MSSKRWIILGIVIICGFILGRLAFRAVLNLMLGGTMFGGNILWNRRKEKECLYSFVY